MHFDVVMHMQLCTCRHVESTMRMVCPVYDMCYCGCDSSFHLFAASHQHAPRTCNIIRTPIITLPQLHSGALPGSVSRVLYGGRRHLQNCAASVRGGARKHGVVPSRGQGFQVHHPPAAPGRATPHQLLCDESLQRWHQVRQADMTTGQSWLRLQGHIWEKLCDTCNSYLIGSCRQPSA